MLGAVVAGNRLFELLHPVHRLLDLWCGSPNQGESFVPVSEWSDSGWQSAKAFLHPQLRTSEFREDLVACVTEMKPFVISQHLSLIDEFISTDSSVGLCLFPLLEQPQPIMTLVERWMQVRPLDLITFKPTDEKQALYMVKQLLLRLEALGYVMLEY